MKKQPNILLAMPCKSDIPVETVNSLMGLNFKGAIRILQGSLIDDSRENIAQDVIKDGFDYLLFVDSDMVFEEDALDKLLADDKDIVTGICFKRVFPYTPAIYKEDDGNKIYMDYPKDALFEINACGMAFCLIKADVLKEVYTEFGTMFKRAYPLGEDLSFCRRWLALNEKDNGNRKIYCDSRVKVGHIGTQIVTEKTYDIVRTRYEQSNTDK